MLDFEGCNAPAAGFPLIGMCRNKSSISPHQHTRMVDYYRPSLSGFWGKRMQKEKEAYKKISSRSEENSGSRKFDRGDDQFWMCCPDGPIEFDVFGERLLDMASRTGPAVERLSAHRKTLGK